MLGQPQLNGQGYGTAEKWRNCSTSFTIQTWASYTSPAYEAHVWDHWSSSLAPFIGAQMTYTTQSVFGAKADRINSDSLVNMADKIDAQLEKLHS